MNKTCQNNRGFVALSAVTIIALLAGFFAVATTPRAWLQAKNTAAARSATIARFNAISCVNIAQLKIFLAETPVEGEYDVKDGDCTIESVSRQTDKIFIQTRATDEDAEIFLQTELDAATLAIISIQEF